MLNGWAPISAGPIRGREVFPEFNQFHGIATELTSYDPTYCFCRLILASTNIIARPDQQQPGDWEDSGLRDPAHDLGDLLTHPQSRRSTRYGCLAAVS